jgi:hypothetical protein
VSAAARFLCHNGFYDATRDEEPPIGDVREHRRQELHRRLVVPARG